MYLIATHIPTFVDGDQLYIDDSWYSDLVLARDYFSPTFGSLALLAPTRPVSDAGDAKLHHVTSEDGIRVHPSIDERTRIRDWRRAAAQWSRDLAPLLAEARVVHASVDDPFRPMQLAALRAAFRERRPTVLIGFDMDVWDTLRVQIRSMSAPAAALHVARCTGMDAWMRHAVRKASVAMLKEGLVYDRYSPGAKNPKAFCHSMHGEEHLIDDATFEARMTRLRSGAPLRFAYFGRFIERKGLLDAVRILARARSLGVDARFDLVGWGPQRAEIEQVAASAGVAEHVGFPGALAYGPELHAMMRRYDALLFTPTEEDTPRMVYDCYAAGLPLLTSDIAFLKRRSRSDRAGVLFGIGDCEGGAAAIARLDRNREELVALSHAARAAGRHHTVEQWYGRRLEWTREAVERHEHARRAA